MLLTLGGFCSHASNCTTVDSAWDEVARSDSGADLFLLSLPFGVLRSVSFVVRVHLGTCDAWTFPSQCFRKARIQRSHPPQSSPHLRKQIVFYFRNNASLNLGPVMAFSHCFRLEAMGRSTLVMEEEACGGSDFSEGCR